MNMLISAASEWVGELLNKSSFADSVDIIVAPPFTALVVVGEKIKGSGIQMAGQNMGLEQEGAWTGEVSAAMLKDAGCDYVILGHSERRQYFAETDENVNRKIKIACDQELNVVFSRSAKDSPTQNTTFNS
jgi:triosephosphate isomerase